MENKKEKDYQSDLKHEAKNWIPYSECIEQEYHNQELKIMPIIEELVVDKCIYDKCISTDELEALFRENAKGLKVAEEKTISEKEQANFNKNLHTELLIRLYKDRCRGSKEEIKKDIYTKIRIALKKYSYSIDGDLEWFLTKTIPMNYLEPFEALNVLGLKWCLDEENEEYQVCRNQAYIYIAELCYNMYSKKSIDDVEDLIFVMQKELEKYNPTAYNPEEQKLGKFISSRMRLRMIGIFKEKAGIVETKRKIPKDAKIEIEGIICESEKIIFAKEKEKLEPETENENFKQKKHLEEVSYGSQLEEGQYAIEENKIYFSKKDIGKEVRITYRKDKEIEACKANKKEKIDIYTKEQDKKAQRMVIELAAAVLNYEEFHNKTTKKGKREEKQRERRKICFTEKLVYTVRKSGYNKRSNLAVDAQKVIEASYLDFFMLEKIITKHNDWLEQLKKENNSLKRACDIWENGNEKELKWSKEGWLEAKVLIEYFNQEKGNKITNPTITELREAYIKWLGLSAVKKGYIQKKNIPKEK